MPNAKSRSPVATMEVPTAFAPPLKNTVTTISCHLWLEITMLVPSSPKGSNDNTLLLFRYTMSLQRTLTHTQRISPTTSMELRRKSALLVPGRSQTTMCTTTLQILVCRLNSPLVRLADSVYHVGDWMRTSAPDLETVINAGVRIVPSFQFQGY